MAMIINVQIVEQQNQKENVNIIGQKIKMKLTIGKNVQNVMT